jgi:hypothetical protein
MDQRELQMLLDEFDRLERECDTPEKARAQLHREGILDANGNLAPIYRPSEEYAR